jgi:hypothetical protein
VLRGYLVAMVIAYLIEGNRSTLGLLPRLAGTDRVALVLLGGCVIVSIVLGKREPGLARWPKYALWSGTAVLLLFSLGGFLAADDDSRNPGYADVGSYGTDPFSYVTDVFVYDGQGRLVTGARLFDQDGNPLQLGSSTWCSDPVTGEVNERFYRSLGYPACPQNAPFGPIAPVPVASSEAPGRPEPTDTVSSSAGPSGAGPTSAGPTSAGPTSAGPTSAGPTSAGPTSAGPSGAGPSGAGPASGGSARVSPSPSR